MHDNCKIRSFFLKMKKNMAEFNWEINKVNSIHFCGEIFFEHFFLFFFLRTSFSILKG